VLTVLFAYIHLDRPIYYGSAHVVFIITVICHRRLCFRNFGHTLAFDIFPITRCESNQIARTNITARFDSSGTHANARQGTTYRFDRICTRIRTRFLKRTCKYGTRFKDSPVIRTHARTHTRYDVRRFSASLKTDAGVVATTFRRNP